MTTTPPKNRNSLWFFLVLGLLTVLATTTLVVYNLWQQLKPEQLQTALSRWKENGPADYVLVYSQKIDTQTGQTTDHYVVKVEGGKTREVLFNGVPLTEPRQLEYHNMSNLLKDIQRFMDLDAKEGSPKTYTRAIFNRNNGALAWYVRRVMGGRQRLEIAVESFTIKGQE